MTLLSAGDIAIIGASFDNPDKISFVVLEDISAGTEINFTDNGVKADGSLRTNEGTWTWSTEQALSAGVVVSIQSNIASIGTVTKSGLLSFSVNGDQVIAYQGNEDNPNFIYAVNMEGNGWQSDATNSNTSTLPSKLLNGHTAIAFKEIDNIAYKGVTTGSKQEILKAIGNSDNWDIHNSDGLNHISSNFVIDGVTALDPVTPNNFTLIHDIQGDTDASSMVGKKVTINAIITAYTPGLKGFYVQEQATEYDSNSKTSEGIFVYYGDNEIDLTMDSIGDTVTLTGQVKEYYGNTQINYLQGFKVDHDGSINDLPKPTVVTLPTTDAFDMESVEGMYVTVRSAKDKGNLVVNETHNLARYGEVMLTSDELQVQYTENNSPNKDGYARHEIDIAKDRIIIEDANTKQNPDEIIFGRNGKPLSADNTLRAGDSIDEVSGVVGYSFGNYKIQTIDGTGYEFTGEDRPTSQDIHSQINDAEITVASANVLNFFTTIGKNAKFTTPYGNVQQSRGAETQEEYDRQLDKLVSMIEGLDADVVGLMEVQNNGYGKDSAIQALVDAVNSKMGEGTYDFIKGPFNNGSEVTAGTDAIMVGMIYKPENVTPVGNAVVPDVEDYPAFANGNRVPLAQAFKSNEDGEIFTTVVNHFKSKGSVIDPDQEDGQANNPISRLQASEQLHKWLANDPTGTGDSDNLLIGDFNAYSKEDALKYLEDHGYDHLEHEGYSFVYKGQWGNLDHAFASDSLADQVTGVTTWQINANEPKALDYNTNYQSEKQQDNLYSSDPYRASDHNPVLIGLNLDSREIRGTSNNDTLIGSDGNDVLKGLVGKDRLIGGAGDDLLIGGKNTDVLIGGEGRDIFVFEDYDTGLPIVFRDVIQDFEKGKDLIDLSAIDADISKEGDQAFSLTSQWFFTAPGQIINFGGTLYFNVDHDLRPDFAIRVKTYNLDSSDFIL